MSQKFKTFAFTLRPRDGVTAAQIEKLCKYCKTHADWYKIITEKEDDARHIHAVWVLKKESTRTNVLVYMTRMFKTLSPEELSVMRNGLKVWYNADFLDYLDKDDDTVVIEENLPELSYLESLFPEKKDPVVKENKKPYLHATMESYESLWYKYQPTWFEPNTQNARDFLIKMQFEKREIGLLTDNQVIQHAKWLVRWMLRANTCVQPLPCFEIEEGKDVHPLNRH